MTEYRHHYFGATQTTSLQIHFPEPFALPASTLRAPHRGRGGHSRPVIEKGKQFAAVIEMDHDEREGGRNTERTYERKGGGTDARRTKDARKLDPERRKERSTNQPTERASEATNECNRISKWHFPPKW